MAEKKDDDLSWSLPPPGQKPASKESVASLGEEPVPAPTPEKRVTETLRKVAIEKRAPVPIAPRPKPGATTSDEDTTGKTKRWGPGAIGNPKPRAPAKTLIGVAPPAPRVPRDLEHLMPPKPGAKKPSEGQTAKFPIPKDKPAGVVVTNKTGYEIKAPTVGRAPMVSLPPDPAVLLVTDGYADALRLEEELGRLSIYVEVATLEDLYRTAVATAPDMVVVAGTAASDGGRRARSQLETSELTAALPMIIVEAAPKLDIRLRASRIGAKLVKDGEPEAVANQIATIARSGGDVPSAAQANSVESAGTATLNELVALLSDELRTGILSVKPGTATGKDAPLRLVLGEGVPLARAIDDFVKQLKQHVLAAEPIEYEVHERPAGSVYVLGKDSVPAPGDANIKGLRIVIADADAARADAVAQELRHRGAEVVVSGLNPDGGRFDRLRRLDASILMIGERDLRGQAFELLRRLHRDTRARWSSWLVVRWDELWPETAGMPEMERVIGACAALGEAEKSLAERARGLATFETRLEMVGPARLLRAISECVEPRRVLVNNPRLQATVDVAGAALLGATASLSQSGKQMSGIEALSALLVVSSGSVRVEHASTPLQNVGLGVISALLDADRAQAPIDPSLRPPPSIDAIGAALLQGEPVPSATPTPVPEPIEFVAPVAPVASIEIREPPPPPRPPPRELEPPAIPEIEPIKLESSFPSGDARRQRAIMVGGAALGALVFFVLLILLLTRSKPENPPVPTSQKPEQPAPSGSAGEESLISRARRGEDEAVAALEKRPNQLSIDESLALAQGRVEHDRREMLNLIRSFEQNPERLTADNKKKLRDWIRDGQLAPDGLRAIAFLPGPRGPDLLYWLSLGTTERTSSAQIAGQLLQSEEVRRKASPALLVALDLRRTEVCEEIEPMLATAKEKGDRRAVRPLARLLRRTGCGPAKAGDCYACLRKGSDLNDAIAATKARPDPSP